MMVYEVENLQSARRFLSTSNKKVTLSNPQGSTRYYGMRVIDQIFKTLKCEFPDQVQGFIVNTYDDYCAFVTARKLGYTQIEYINKAA